MSAAADHLREKIRRARGRIAQAEQSAREADRAMAIAQRERDDLERELAELLVAEDRAERERRKRREKGRKKADRLLEQVDKENR